MRAEFLDESLSTLLSRLSPPAGMRDNAAAMEAEVDAMRRSLTSAAPTQGYEAWWQRFEDALLSRAKTRSWPLLSEVKQASKEADPSTGPRGSSMSESRILDALIDWKNRTGRQLPGYGSAARTRELISRGIFRNEREARFMGFDLDQRMTDMAHAQPPTRPEWDKHIRVTARLRDITEEEAEWQERQNLPPSELPA